ncbi:MAG: glycosyltransferase family 4 protein [Chloroflexi bacterium]|uniref:glycosyltransferase family 4 protein n=1 Tax=Candidatus Flexifilum breve TaxID=3140694 RepID=UPI003136E70E|nr:glycosyltransferase family 4 protein [Chloroflexota bacterium]
MTEPIRILRIIARLNIGGPAIHVTLLTEKLGAPVYHSTLVCGNIEAGEGDMQYFAEKHGVTPLLLPELGRSLNPLRDLSTIWQLYQLMREMQPQVVHTHTAKAGFVGRVAAKLAGVPVIVHTFHGHVFQGYFSPAKTKMFILLERITARLSDTVITLTEGLRRELSEEYGIARRSRITVLPLGLDLEAFARVPRQSGDFRSAHSIAPDVPLIGIVGRLVPIKNHELFLQAAVKVRERLPNACFAIIGDGELRAELEATTARLGLTDCVRFVGWVREVAPVYSDLDALVISSRNEGTPVSVIEALSARCPVVTTAVGGLPDLLDQGALGTLVPTEDVNALADAIVRTVTAPPDTTRAQQLMLDRYGIDRLVMDLDQLYRGILAKKGKL